MFVRNKAQFLVKLFVVSKLLFQLSTTQVNLGHVLVTPTFTFMGMIHRLRRLEKTGKRKTRLTFMDVWSLSFFFLSRLLFKKWIFKFMQENICLALSFFCSILARFDQTCKNTISLHKHSLNQTYFTQKSD